MLTLLLRHGRRMNYIAQKDISRVLSLVSGTFQHYRYLPEVKSWVRGALHKMKYGGFLNQDDITMDGVTMVQCSIVEADIDETGFSYTLSLINGKYKMLGLHQGNIVQDAQRQPEGTGGGWSRPQGGVPPGASEGRVLAHGDRQIPDTDPGFHVRMGRRASQGFLTSHPERHIRRP